MSDTKYVPRLQVLYKKEISKKLMDQFNFSNVMEIPRLEKVVLNMGIKDGVKDAKIVEHAAQELSLIAGQKPVVTLSKKSIAGFKLRDGMPVGVKVTLRKAKMWEFVDRVINVAMPRIRDFRGYSPKSFDQSGNYTFGIQEQMIFPEVEYDKIKRVQGMDVTFVTSAKNIEEGRKLLELLGFPFRKSSENG